MPASQDSRDNYVKYHLLERKWHGVWVCVCLCALVCFEMCMCVCVCACANLCLLLGFATHKHIVAVHTQRDLCWAQMTLEEKEKQAKCLIIHQ